jgi:hypothetical protein
LSPNNHYGSHMAGMPPNLFLHNFSRLAGCNIHFSVREVCLETI